MQSVVAGDLFETGPNHSEPYPISSLPLHANACAALAIFTPPLHLFFKLGKFSRHGV